MSRDPADERIGQGLRDLGGDLDPPPGWEARVLATVERRPRLHWRTALLAAVPVLIGGLALLLGLALGRCL